MLLVVGGHRRKIGKSAIVSGLIRNLPRAGWTAVKITTHLHTEAPGQEEYLVHEESSSAETDSGRYLDAGAVRSFWVSARPGALSKAMPEIRRLAAESRNTIIESNSILDHIEPDLYLVVVAPGVKDWKDSARRHLERADAFIVVAGEPGAVDDLPLPGDKPRFEVSAPSFESRSLIQFVERRLR